MIIALAPNLARAALNSGKDEEFREFSIVKAPRPCQNETLGLEEAIERKREEMERLRAFARPFIDAAVFR